MCLAVVVALPAHAGPEPALAPRNWELSFEFSDPQRISVQLPGRPKLQVFWYVVYRAVNETRQDVEFYPTFEIVTDRFKTVPAELATHPAVYEAVRKRHAKTHPFLVEPVDALGRLLQGEDNARSSVAIWPAFDAEEDIDKFVLFVGGLSGEVVKVRNPGFKASEPEDEQNNPRFFVLRKTLAVEYGLPGNLQTQQQASPTRIERSWVMR
jgi:hypothetical protein